MIVDDRSLAHYGVLGMRWGVRKSRSKARGTTPGWTGGKRVTKSTQTGTTAYKKKKHEYSEDAITALKLRKRGIQNLSNEELKTLITRRQLERQLRDIDKQDISKGRQWAEKSIMALGSTAVGVIGTGVVKPYVEAAIKARFGGGD